MSKTTGDKAQGTSATEATRYMVTISTEYSTMYDWTDGPVTIATLEELFTDWDEYLRNVQRVDRLSYWGETLKLDAEDNELWVACWFKLEEVEA